MDAGISPPPHSPPGPLPSISVLIPAFNEEKLISEVLEAVRESFRGANFHSYEIIVCDNNSTDSTAVRARKKGATVVHEPHNQIAKARNRAASHAVGDWLIFIDADTLLSTELLGATIDCLKSGQVCGGGSVVAFNSVRLGLLAGTLLGFWNQVSRLFKVAAGSYLFCYRDAWRETGGFDESLYAGEELFFSRKIRRWGSTRGMRFTVLTGAPIVTSARKLEWYGGWHLLWSMVKLAVPGALRKRDQCGTWYIRPAQARDEGADSN